MTVKEMRKQVKLELGAFPYFDAQIKAIELDIIDQANDIRISNNKIDIFSSSGSSSSIVENNVLLINDKVNALKLKKSKIEHKKKKIELALDVLKEEECEIIRMKYFKDMSWLQIGDKLNRDHNYCNKICNKLLDKISTIILN